MSDLNLRVLLLLLGRLNFLKRLDTEGQRPDAFVISRRLNLHLRHLNIIFINEIGRHRLISTLILFHFLSLLLLFLIGILSFFHFQIGIHLRSCDSCPQEPLHLFYALLFGFFFFFLFDLCLRFGLVEFLQELGLA